MERNRKKDVNVPLLADDMTGKDETLNLYQKTLRTDKHFQAIRIQNQQSKTQYHSYISLTNTLRNLGEQPHSPQL